MFLSSQWLDRNLIIYAMDFSKPDPKGLKIKSIHGCFLELGSKVQSSVAYSNKALNHVIKSEALE